MRKTLLRLAILGALAVPGASHAANGVVNMTWHGCNGPLDVTAPADTLSLYLTVSGIDQPHKAYDVRFIYGNAAQEVPDAWRFDAQGCEGSVLIRQDIAVAKACPSFMQAATGLQIRRVDFVPPSEPYAQTMMWVLLANSYTPVTTVDPSATYLLERVLFDLSYAVPGAGDPPNTCGGFEQAMFFTLTRATYLDPNFNEFPFGRARLPLTVSVNTSVPARPTTWGAIKGQYR